MKYKLPMRIKCVVVSDLDSSFPIVCGLKEIINRSNFRHDTRINPHLKKTSPETHGFFLLSMYLDIYP